MYREIKKKKLILEYRKPFTGEALRLLSELDAADWIYSSLRLDGHNISRTFVERVLAGDFVVDISIGEHAAIGNHQEAIRMLRDLVDMDGYLNEKVLLKLYETLVRPEVAEYRRSNPVLRMLSYNPPHFKEIQEQMSLLFHWLHGDPYLTNPIEKAALLHNKLIEIYPFETGSEAVARMAAQYILLTAGFPAILWNISEQEYYDAIRLYLKNEDIQPIYDVLERGVYNKLEVMLQLTAE